MTEVFSSGGGTQSACIAALIVQGRLPKPDVAVIVDTERERPAVWEYHDAVIVPALALVGVTMHRVAKSQFARRDLWSGKKGETLLLPVFRKGAGKASPFCSDEWKRRVRERFLRSLGIPTREQKTWIGFSLDEGSRYTRAKLSDNGERLRFPLIEDVPLRRQEAIQEVEKMGWPTPPRSSCWMCPNQSNNEWRDLRDNWPDAFTKAVELEREIRQREPESFFHSSRVALEEIDFGTQPDLAANNCNSGACFT